MGFLQLTKLDCESIWKELDEKPTPLDEAIRISMEPLEKVCDGETVIHSPVDENLLSEEVKFFCMRLLGRHASQEMINSYNRAHMKLPVNLSIDKEKIRTIVVCKLDPVAIEFATRSKLKSLNLKLNLVCYLAENLPGYSEVFEIESKNKIRIFFELFYCVLITPIVFLKGLYLSRRYQLV